MFVVSLYVYITQKKVKNVKYYFPPRYLIISVSQYVLYHGVGLL